MEISRTFNNISQFKKAWLEFEVDWLLLKGIKKVEIASALGMSGAAFSMVLGRVPSDKFLDRFMENYGLSIILNNIHEDQCVFNIDRNFNPGYSCSSDDCFANNDMKCSSFSLFKKLWFQIELNDLKEKGFSKKSIAKKLNYVSAVLSTYISNKPTDIFID